MTDNLDPFAAGGRASDVDADQEILAIFRRWAAAESSIPRGAADELVAEACDQASAVALEIATIPAVGIVGLAVKAYLVLHEQHGAPAGKPTAIYPHDASEAEVGLLDDLVRFVPEIAALVEPDIEPDTATERPLRAAALRARAEALAAEFRGPLPAGDAGLIEAERRRDELERRISELSCEFKPTMEEEAQFIDIAGERPLGTDTPGAVETELYDFIIESTPEGLAGVAVKLRLLGSMQADPETTEGFMLGQCLDAIAAAIGTGASE